MADGPRCKRRKQANPRRKNGKKRPEPNFSGPLRGSRPREKEGEREREPRRRRRRRPGLAGEPLSVAGAGARRARRLDPGSWGSAGQSERGAPGGSERWGPVGAPRPHPATPLCPRLHPPAASASLSASARSAGSPAGLRECPARAGRGPGRQVLQDPGAGAGVAEELRGRERGPGAVPPQGLKFLAGVSRPPLRTPSNGPRAAGPGRARPKLGWEGLGRPCAGSGRVHAGSGVGGSSPAGSGPTPGTGGVEESRESFLGSFYMVRRSPLSKLSQEGGRRWGCEGDTQTRGGRLKG